MARRTPYIAAALLDYLAARPGQEFTAPELAREVCGSVTFRSHVHALLTRHAAQGRVRRTVVPRGGGRPVSRWQTSPARER